jgi:hypothetical protein
VTTKATGWFSALRKNSKLIPPGEITFTFMSISTAIMALDWAPVTKLGGGLVVKLMQQLGGG